MNKTISYYNQNALEYFDSTVNISMQTLYEQFEKCLKSGDKILDLGCGSGRDSKYFLSKGYEVVSVDGSIEMCHLAEEYLGKEVRNITFNDLDYVEEFDAVWACASLLHVCSEELLKVLEKVYQALSSNGILFASWKYGEGERSINHRWYCDLNESTIANIFLHTSFKIENIWLSEDGLKRKDKWINIICKKERAIGDGRKH